MSDWQGHPDWGAVAGWERSHGWRTGGVFKLGEYTYDPDAGYNAQATMGLSWRAGYWFVRAIGCRREAGMIHQAAIWWHLRLVILDIEVPAAAGYSTCLIPALRAVHLVVAVYTGSGTWPGGSTYGAPLWVAAYGQSPSYARLWTTSAVAWQFTDGRYGNVTPVPGVGADDVSVDWGLSNLASPPAPRLVCFGSHAHPRDRACRRVIRQIAGWERAAASSRRAYAARGCPAIAQRIAWFGRMRHEPPARLRERRQRAYATSVRAYGRAGCGVFAGRVSYFTGLAARARARYRS